MEKLFVSYEIAIKLKEKGFSEWCFGVYTPEFKCVSHYGVGESFTGMWQNGFNSNDITAPMHQQVIDWFRENHNINILYIICGGQTKVLGYKWFVQKGMEKDAYETNMKDYYAGLNEALTQALKLI